jgi:type II secretory pathway component PulK
MIRCLTNDRGVALVITLFVVALVTILVLEYYFDASVEIELAANYADDVRAYHLALSGVNFARAVLLRDERDVDGPEDLWYKLGLLPACFPPQQLLTLASEDGGGPLVLENTESLTATTPSAEGCVSLRIVDEQSKLPINALAAAADGQSSTGGQGSPTGQQSATGQDSPTGRKPTTGQSRATGQKSTTGQDATTGQKAGTGKKPTTGPGTSTGQDSASTTTWLHVFERFFESFQIDPEKLEALRCWVGQVSDCGAVNAYYESLEHPYKATNGPMRTPGELRLVRGFDAETLARLFPGLPPEGVPDADLGNNGYLTAYGTGQEVRVNLNTASPEVLHALLAGLQDSSPGSITSFVEEIIAQRQEKPLEDLNALKQQIPGLDQVAGVTSTYFRVVSTGVVGVIQKRAVAVLKREQTTGGEQQSSISMVYLKLE